MAIDTASPRSRRAILAAAFGAGAATVASALGRPLPAKAGDGDALILGSWYNTATSATRVQYVSNEASTVLFMNDGTATALSGSCSSGVGIGGGSMGSHGVVGSTEAVGSGVGVAGAHLNGMTGVLGISGDYPPASGPAQTGVYGYAAQGASARGVFGQSTSGQGVRGQATSGTGLYGTATTGYALRTSGRVKVDKASGVATIPAAKASILVTPGLDVTSTSFVLLTPKGDLGARRLWYTTNATANTFTIRVSAAVTANFHVGWLLLG